MFFLLRDGTRFALCGLLLTAAGLLPDNSRTIAADKPQRELTIGMTNEALQKELRDRVTKKFAPISISSHYSSGKVVNSVIWEKRTSGEIKVRYGLTGEEMKDAILENYKKNYRLEQLTSAGTGGFQRYNAVWSAGQGFHLVVRYEYPAKELLKLNTAFVQKGYVIHSVVAVEDRGKTRFTAIWEKDKARNREFQIDMRSGIFLNQVRVRRKNGYRLRQVFTYLSGRQLRFGCIWDRTLGPEQEVRVGLTDVALQKLNKQLTGQGYVPSMLSAVSVGGRDRYVMVWDKPDK